MNHRYVIISGLPAAGKTRLGRSLSERLGWPLLSKDVIKEALADSLGLGDEAWSLQLSKAAMEVLHRTALVSPAAVMDANFKVEPDRDRLIALRGKKVQLFCHAPPDVIVQRMKARAVGRHPIHRDAMAPEKMAAELRTHASTWAPLDLGVPVLSVDTSLLTDEAAILAWVKDALDIS